MKKFLRIFKNLRKSFDQKGFTLIELLVVIGVLGILATGLLATIDPLEQFRKGADSNRRTTALELNNALTRYYSVHGTFPWYPEDEGGPVVPCNGGTVPSVTPVRVTDANAASDFDDCLEILINEGELKSTFRKQYGILGALWLADTTPANSTSKAVGICFDPDSKSESTKPGTSFAGGASGPTLPLDSDSCDPASLTNCYSCIQ